MNVLGSPSIAPFVPVAIVPDEEASTDKGHYQCQLRGLSRVVHPMKETSTQFRIELWHPTPKAA